jgi:2-polyprenyl-3-methyl-5-hydroxy-6-metoxy-1,4-benzoquinol methylase
MAALRPDYDDDPERWTSWKAPQDIHELVAPELEGPVLDVGCGDGRLAALAAERGIACWPTCASCPSGMAHSMR